MVIFKKILKVSLVTLLMLISLVLGLFVYFNLPVTHVNEDAQLGVTFSSRYASDIGLEWKDNFLAMLDDMKVRKIRIPVYWDLAEPKEGEYDFANIDWQLREARKRNAEIILVIGQKVPRWPECFIPAWTDGDVQKKKESLLKFMATVVGRYKDASEIRYWQVENEPFLPFGACPPLDADLLDNEIAIVRNADPSRKIIITDSGELSLWYQAARRADIFGTTMYRAIYKKGLGYFNYPIGPRFFQFKHMVSKIFTGQDSVIVTELQGEPWIAGWTVNAPLEQQFESMNPEKLRENVLFARKVGFPEIYLWGIEWWYWLKVNQNHPELWDTAKNLFDQNKK